MDRCLDDEDPKSRRTSMADEFGKLTLTIDEDALNKIVADGRIAEFTNTLAQLAGEQIPAQVVDHFVKRTAESRASGSAVDFALVMDEGGGFGTRPHLPIGPHHAFES
jgi:hypothetical protein